MILRIVYSPAAAYDQLKDRDILGLAIVLMLIRFTGTAFNTVLAMYLRRSPMLLKPLFGLDPQTYRLYETMWYGPYGLLMILIITFAIAQTSRRLYHRSDVTFRKSFEIIALAFFIPWLPSVPGDWLLLTTVNAHPAFLVPFHISLLVWECALVSIGMQRVYGISRDHSGMLGLTAFALFIGLGGLLIR